MRKITFILFNTLLCGILLLQGAGRVHAATEVIGQNTPNFYNPPNQAAINQQNNAYAAGEHFQDYDANMIKLEKSMDTVTGSNRVDTIQVTNSSGPETSPVNAPTINGKPPIVGTSQITVGWGANGDPAGTTYLVQISLDPSFSALGDQSVTTTALSATFAGLVPGTQYYMQVQAVSANGAVSAFTPLPSASTLSNPPAPGFASIIATNQITVNWGANGNPAGTTYLVQASVDLSFISSGTITMTTNSLSATFSELNPDTQYYMRVESISPTAVASAFTALPPATTLSGLGATTEGTIDRGVYDGEHYYEVYWTLPKGETCLNPNSGPATGTSTTSQESIYLVHSQALSDTYQGVDQSYVGPSGGSSSVCQVNVHAPAGSGPALLWFDYGTYANGQITANLFNVSTMTLSF